MSKRTFDRKKFGKMTSKIMKNYHKNNPRPKEFYAYIRSQGVAKRKAEMKEKSDKVAALWGKKKVPEIALEMGLTANYIYKLKKNHDKGLYE